MKTEKLFKYYNSILSENVEGGAPDATDVAEVPAEAMAVDPAAITTEGEKIHADLLVKAFFIHQEKMIKQLLRNYSMMFRVNQRRILLKSQTCFR